MKKKCLVLGGTYFIGKETVTKLLESKLYSVYVANRGTKPSPVSKRNSILLDRDDRATCEILKKYTFDITIDHSCYTPTHFRNTMDFISTDYYIYLSSSCVLLDDINHPMYSYCHNKKICESLVQKNFKNSLIVRPSYVVGENDYTNRFYKDPLGEVYYWRDNDEILSEYIDVDVLSSTLLNLIKFPQNGIVKVGYRALPE